MPGNRVCTIVVLCATVLAGCSSYQILEAPKESFIDYGEWEVPKAWVNPAILNQYSDDEDWEQWKKNVDHAASSISEALEDFLYGHSDTGKPMKVNLIITRFEPARGFGGFGKVGILEVEATFVDKGTGATLARCKAQNRPERGIFVGHENYYIDMADRLSKFVVDCSR